MEVSPNDFNIQFNILIADYKKNESRETLEKIQSLIEENLKTPTITTLNIHEIKEKLQSIGSKKSHPELCSKINQIILELSNIQQDKINLDPGEQGMQKLEILSYKLQEEENFINLTCLINGQKYEYKYRKLENLGLKDIPQNKLLEGLRQLENHFKKNIDYPIINSITVIGNIYSVIFFPILKVEQIGKILQFLVAQDETKELKAALESLKDGQVIDPDGEKKMKSAIENLRQSDIQSIGEKIVTDDLFNSFPSMLRFLSPYLDYSEEDFAKNFYYKAFFNNDLAALDRIFSKHPQLVNDENVKNFFLRSFLPKKLDLIYIHDLIHILLKHGFSPNFTIQALGFKQTPEQCYYQLLKKDIGDLKNTNTQEKIIHILESLLTQGMPPNASLSLSGETSCSLLEGIFLYLHASNPSLSKKLTRLLLDKGAKITPRIAHEMKIEMKASKDPFFVEDLKKQGFLNEVETKSLLSQEKFKKGSTTDLLSQLITSKMLLEHYLQIYHLCPSSIPLSEMERIKALKKEVKLYLKEADAKDVTDLESFYQDFSKVYDAVIDNHHFLHTLKEISQELRTISTDVVKKPSSRLVRFYSLWSPDQKYGYTDAAQRIQKLFTSNRSTYWQEIRQAAIKGADQTQKSSVLQKNQIVWMHGTKSSSIPSIAKMQGLVPMGMLFEMGGVPFSGEFSGSDTSYNKESLSGEALTLHWEDKGDKDSFSGKETFYHDASTRLLVNWLYASKKEGYHESEKEFDPKASWNRASLSYLSELMNQAEPNHRLWTVLRVDILRLRLTDQDANQKLLPLKNEICKLLAQESPASLIFTELNSLLDALNKKISYHLSPEDLKVIQAPPYPVIFASTTVATEKLSQDEYLAKGHLKFGSDIQIAFTSNEHLEDLTKLLSPFGIEVLDIETAKYLETMNMIRGSRNLEMQEKNIPPQHMISTILQQDILPHYATPFPKEPTYIDEDSNHQRKKVDRPFYGLSVSGYHSYIQQVEQGTLLPRSIHGSMHASRVALWTQLLFNINKKDQTQTLNDINPIWLAIAGGAHDISRQDEGRDLWDRESSFFIQSYLQALGVDSKDIKRFAYALAEKDPKDGKFIDIIQAIIHDADCLEINRVLNDPSQQFRKEELCFFKDSSLSLEEKEAILKEIQLFIALTEDAEVKKHLEKHSQSYYGDLICLIREMHQDKGSFPHLTSWLEKEIDAYKNKNIDLKLVDLIT